MNWLLSFLLFSTPLPATLIQAGKYLQRNIFHTTCRVFLKLNCPACFVLQLPLKNSSSLRSFLPSFNIDDGTVLPISNWVAFPYSFFWIFIWIIQNSDLLQAQTSSFHQRCCLDSHDRASEFLRLLRKT